MRRSVLRSDTRPVDIKASVDNLDDPSFSGDGSVGNEEEKASERESGTGSASDDGEDSDSENFSGFRTPRQSVTDVFETSSSSERHRKNLSKTISSIGGNIKAKGAKFSRRMSHAVTTKKRGNIILERVKFGDYLSLLKEKDRTTRLEDTWQAVFDELVNNSQFGIGQVVLKTVENFEKWAQSLLRLAATEGVQRKRDRHSNGMDWSPRSPGDAADFSDHPGGDPRTNSNSNSGKKGRNDLTLSEDAVCDELDSLKVFVSNVAKHVVDNPKFAALLWDPEVPSEDAAAALGVDASGLPPFDEMHKRFEPPPSREGCLRTTREGGGGEGGGGEGGWHHVPDSKEKLQEQRFREVYKMTEFVVFQPLLEALGLLLMVVMAHRDQGIMIRLATMQSHYNPVPAPQELFGIPEQFRSPSNWKSVMELLRGIDEVSLLPSQRLDQLQACMNGIVECAKEEQGAAANSLSADDLLPIFIYAVAHANLRHHHSTLTFLLHTTPRHEMMMQTGYSLTMLESAVFFILNLEGPWDEAQKAIRVRNERLHSDASSCRSREGSTAEVNYAVVDESTAANIIRASSVRHGADSLADLNIEIDIDASGPQLQANEWMQSGQPQRASSLKRDGDDPFGDWDATHTHGNGNVMKSSLMSSQDNKRQSIDHLKETFDNDLVKAVQKVVDDFEERDDDGDDDDDDDGSYADPDRGAPHHRNSHDNYDHEPGRSSSQDLNELDDGRHSLLPSFHSAFRASLLPSFLPFLTPNHPHFRLPSFLPSFFPSFRLSFLLSFRFVLPSLPPSFKKNTTPAVRWPPPRSPPCRTVRINFTTAMCSTKPLRTRGVPSFRIIPTTSRRSRRRRDWHRWRTFLCPPRICRPSQRNYCRLHLSKTVPEQPAQQRPPRKWCVHARKLNYCDSAFSPAFVHPKCTRIISC
jgi:hypothetical protein